jgi:tRNA G37 N-methylase Trm5
MFISIKYLFSTPYNKKNKFFALYRFFIWKMIRAFKLNNFRFRIWNNRKIILTHSSIQCMYLMYNYWVDWEEYNLIKDVLRVNDIVFDVGANIGIYSLWMSKFTPEGNIHSFEPDNDNYNALKKNIELNKLEPSVHINKIGISDSTGFLFLTQGADVKNHLAFEKKMGFKKYL